MSRSLHATVASPCLDAALMVAVTVNVYAERILDYWRSGGAGHSTGVELGLVYRPSAASRSGKPASDLKRGGYHPVSLPS